MSRRLMIRMWLYRVGRGYERWLKILTGAGFVGLLLTGLLYNLVPEAGRDWQMVFMGICLIVAGMGHALLGEGATLEAYATGETEEMPAITKLLNGLLASAGGLMITMLGLSQIMA